MKQIHKTTCEKRRLFLKQASLISLGGLAMPALSLSKHADTNVMERNLSFYNLHTHEKLSCCYYADGQYLEEGLAQINHHLRDFRTGDIIEYDPKLIQALYRLKEITGTKQPFHVISGYRSPKTNEMLRKQGRRVAKRSYHLKGKAVDIYLPDVSLRKLKDAAVSLKVGGVGYYPRSNFVHIDTGPVRRW